MLKHVVFSRESHDNMDGHGRTNRGSVAAATEEGADVNQKGPCNDPQIASTEMNSYWTSTSPKRILVVRLGL